MIKEKITEVKYWSLQFFSPLAVKTPVATPTKPTTSKRMMVALSIVKVMEQKTVSEQH